jgi:MoxR-like ATPase
VVITSNRTREVHDALKRRCLYHWIDYPDYQTELRIVQLKVPGISIELTKQLISAVQYLRQAELFKPPGIAETLDWGNALIAMDRKRLDEATLSDTLGVLLKYQDDVQRAGAELMGELLNTSDASG